MYVAHHCTLSEPALMRSKAATWAASFLASHRHSSFGNPYRAGEPVVTGQGQRAEIAPGERRAEMLASANESWAAAATPHSESQTTFVKRYIREYVRRITVFFVLFSVCYNYAVVYARKQC